MKFRFYTLSYQVGPKIMIYGKNIISLMSHLARVTKVALLVEEKLDGLEVKKSKKETLIANFKPSPFRPPSSSHDI